MARGKGIPNRPHKEIHEHFSRDISRNPKTLPGKEGVNLIVLAGMPGTGKSTLARSVWPDAEIICPDVYRALAPNSAGEWDQTASKWAFKHAHEDAFNLLMEGKNVVFDSLAATASARAQLREIAQRAGARFHLIILDRGMAQALSSNHERGRYNPMGEVPVHVLERVHRNLSVDSDDIVKENYDSINIITDPSQYGVTPQEREPIKLRSSKDRKRLIEFLDSDNPAEMLDQMRDSGELATFLPEIQEGVGFDQQNPYHKYTLYEHTRAVFHAMCERTKNRALRFAALYHDNRKVSTKWLGEKTVVDENGKPVLDENGQKQTYLVGHYYRPRKATPDHPGYGKVSHEVAGAQTTLRNMQEFGFSPEETRRGVIAVRDHMFHDFERLETDEQYLDAAHRFLARHHYDPQTARDLMLLRVCDRSGKGTELSAQDKLEIDRMYEAVEAALKEGRRIREAPKPKVRLALRGDEIRDLLGLKGQQIGLTVQHLQELVSQDESLNSRAALLKKAQHFAGQQLLQNANSDAARGE